MELRKAIPAIWVYTTGDAFNAIRPGEGAYGEFLTRGQQAKVERVRQARLLFDGKHREYFLNEGRTQFDFPETRAGGRTDRMYLTYNLLGLISNKAADLLFGEQPILRVDDATQQDYLTALVERSNLHQVFQSAALDCSYEAEAFLESCVHDGEVYVQKLDAGEVFCVGPVRPDGQFAQYDRYQVENVGTDREPVHLLLITSYVAGAIRREVWQLNRDGSKQQRVTLDRWPSRPVSGEWADVVTTGIDRNTVTWVPNLLVRGNPVSDYDGAIDLQDKVNAATTQIGRVLAKHSDPKIAFPAEMFGQDGNVRSDHDAFAFNDPNQVPKYITWNAELEQATRDRSFAVNALLIKTETSPVLLGLKEGAAPDAYKKVRLESFNSLTKAGRKAVFWKAAIRRAVGVAQDLENTLPGKVGYDRYPIGVELRDGIPADDEAVAQTQTLLIGAGAMSVEGALEARLNDPAAVEKELSRIEADRKAKAAELAPTVLMGGGGGGGAPREPGEPPPQQQQQQQGSAQPEAA